MQLNKEQTTILAGYFSDLSKILLSSLVIGFFIPATSGPITVSVLVGGTIVGVSFIAFSIFISK